MKLGVRYREQVYPIEIEQSQKNRDQFSVAIESGVYKTDQPLLVRVLSYSQHRWTLEIGGKIEDILLFEQRDKIWVDWRSQTFPIEVLSLRGQFSFESQRTEVAGPASVKAQMPGKVVELLNNLGDQVETGQGMAVIEAMKMQNELTAPKAGTVVVCHVRPGDPVDTGDVLFEIE